VLATDTLLVFCSFFLLPSFFLEEGEGGGASLPAEKAEKNKKKSKLVHHSLTHTRVKTWPSERIKDSQKGRKDRRRKRKLYN
jgi:hypothetical protein